MSSARLVFYTQQQKLLISIVPKSQNSFVNISLKWEFWKIFSCGTFSATWWYLKVIYPTLNIAYFLLVRYYLLKLIIKINKNIYLIIINSKMCFTKLIEDNKKKLVLNYWYCCRSLIYNYINFYCV